MIQKVLPEKTYQQAMDTAVRLLAHRDHFSRELEQKLKRRDFASPIIAGVLAECRRLNYVDDERTARVYISQLSARGFGRRYMRRALKKKGFRGDPERIISQSTAEIDERAVAARLLQKRMPNFQREQDPPKRRAKIYRFLYARGFAADVITELIHKYG